MKKKYFVEENLNEFARRGRPKKRQIETGDKWYSSEDEFDNEDIEGPEHIEDVNLKDETLDFAPMNIFKRKINNKLKLPESDRKVIDLRLKTGEKISGIPLAKLSGGEAVLFKTEKGMKKVKVDDIIFESANETKPKLFVKESIKYYESKKD